jgi:hypothetical protein
MATVDNVSRSSRAYSEGATTDAEAPQRRAVSRLPAPPPRGSLLDREIASYAANAAGPPPLPAPRNDEVLFVGMNGKSAGSEAAALRAAGVSTKCVDAHGGDVEAGFDLASTEGRKAFVASLAVAPAVAADVERVLAHAGPRERTVLGQIAKAWAAGERGGSVPSRLVVSGHSGGQTVWGDHAELSLDQVRALAKAMPRAASQVEDIHLSACSTRGNAVQGKAWREAFPNLKTMWAYNGTAPSPAGGHLVAWSALTKGHRAELTLDASMRAARIAVWSPTKGYEDGSGPIEGSRARAASAEARLAAYTDGTRRIASSGDAEARRAYEALRELSTRPDATTEEMTRTHRAAEMLVRARYYEEGVRRSIAETYGPALRDAWRSVGLPPPDFARMTRHEALRSIADFEAKLDALGPATPEAALRSASTVRGLATLDETTIPLRWCTH